MNYENAVVDLETLDVRGSAIIVSIGMVAFNDDQIETSSTLDDERRTLYLFPDMDEQSLLGRSASTSTISWWINQGPQAKAAFSSNIQRQSCSQVTDTVTAFFERHNIQRLWGYGNTFDNVILQDFFRTVGAKWPLSYRADMDIRTLEYLSGKSIKDLGIERGTLHDAYWDAIFEAEAIQLLVHRLRVSGTSRIVRTRE